MKNKFFILRLSGYLLSGFLFLILSLGVNLKTFNTGIPTDWIVVPGYSTLYNGGFQTTTAGVGGEVMTVTSQSQQASINNFLFNLN